MSTDQASEVRWVVVFERWSKRALWDAFRHRDDWRDKIISGWSQAFDDCSDTVDASLTVETLGELMEAFKCIQPHMKYGDNVVLMVEAEFGVANVNANLTMGDGGMMESSATMYHSPSHESNAEAFSIVCGIEEGLRKLHHLAIVRTKDGQELRRKNP